MMVDELKQNLCKYRSYPTECVCVVWGQRGRRSQVYWNKRERGIDPKDE